MKLKIVLIALAFLLPVVFVHAEDGLTPCFNYYKFGSVQVDISPVNKDTLAGTNLVFQGNIRNTNTYPIVDGAVYLKIFRKANQSNGWELVDQFFAQKDLNIDSQKQLPISFTWKVPAYAVGGDYKVATYFVTQDRFNLSGLSFTEDIVDKIVPFKVTGEQKTAVTFDRTSVKVAGEQYVFAAFTPRVSKGGDVQVEFSLKNSNLVPKNAQLTYTVYSWDGLKSEKILDSKKETVSLKAGEIKKLSYVVKDNNHPVYYVVLESKVDDTKSIIDVRFVREELGEARLNFPALANYPLKKGTEATIFSCFHNAGLSDSIQGGKVVMTLTDNKGKQIDTFTWSGNITGSMMGIKKSFIPTKDYGNLILITDLYVAGKLVESSRSYYECEKINSEICLAETMAAVENTSSMMAKIVIGLALLVLIVAIFAYHGHLKRKDVGTVALLFAATVGLGMYQVNAKLVSAVIATNGTTPMTLSQPSNYERGTYKYIDSQNGNKFKIEASGDGSKYYLTSSAGEQKVISGGYTDAYINIDTFDFEYRYGAEMQYSNGTVIPKGSVIPLNSKIKFVPTTFRNDQIAWYITGSTYDTPFAYWSGNGAVPKCGSNDWVAVEHFKIAPNSMEYAVLRAYLPIVVTKPTINIDVSGSTATLQYNSQDGTYTVTAAGSIDADVIFRETPATASLQYYVSQMKGNSTYSDLCRVFNQHTFNLSEKIINLNATVPPIGNLPPNPPTFTMPDACQNVPANGYITPASPADPNPGDTVTYQYQIDESSAYGPIQNTANQGFSKIFTTTGVKKIRVRTIDQGNLTSAWVDGSVRIRNCDSISAYCIEPAFVGDRPQWKAESFSSNTSITFSYVWDWVSRAFTVSGTGNNTLLGPSMTDGTTITGPNVIMTASNGTTQSLTCPPATYEIDNNNGSDGISATCKVDTIGLDFIPQWRVRASGGNGRYSYTWSGLVGQGDDYKFTADNPIPLGGTISSLRVDVRDSSGRKINGVVCEDVTRNNSPRINLLLSDVADVRVKKMVIQKGALAFANTTSNAVTGCRSSKTKKSGTLGNPLWGTDDFDTYSNGVGVSKLSEYPLTTIETGEFELRVTCDDTATPPNTLFSTSTLIITEAPNYEEF
jgi:hypothetical protein